MIERLVYWLPSATWPLILMGVALAIMVGIFPRRRAGSVISAMIGALVFPVVILALLALLPFPLRELAILVLVLLLVARAGSFFLGRHLWHRLRDRLIWGLLSAPFRMLRAGLHLAARRAADRPAPPRRRPLLPASPPPPFPPRSRSVANAPARRVPHSPLRRS